MSFKEERVVRVETEERRGGGGGVSLKGHFYLVL